jgi:hypothetical protein
MLGVGGLEPDLVLFREEIIERLNFALFIHVPTIGTVVETDSGGSGSASFHPERVNLIGVSVSHLDIGAVASNSLRIEGRGHVE